MAKSPSITMGTYMKLLCILPLIFAPIAVVEAGCTKYMTPGNCVPGDKENGSKECDGYCVSSMDMYDGTCFIYADIEEIVGSHNILDVNGNPIVTEDHVDHADNQIHDHHGPNEYDEDDGGDELDGYVHFSGLTDQSQELYQYFDDHSDEYTYGQLIGDSNPKFWNDVLTSIAGGPPTYICFCCSELQ